MNHGPATRCRPPLAGADGAGGCSSDDGIGGDECSDDGIGVGTGGDGIGNQVERDGVRREGEASLGNASLRCVRRLGASGRESCSNGHERSSVDAKAEMPEMPEVGSLVPNSLSVLVVDDDDAISSLLRALIVAAGGEVWNTFASGEDALAEVVRRVDVGAPVDSADRGRASDESAVVDDAARAPGERLPDVALLDVFLPGIDGIEVGRRLQALCPTLRVVLVSSSDLGDLPSDVLDGGASEFVPKADLGPERIRDLLGT